MTTYYVKNGGNDALDGLSDATAWASLGKAANANVGGGDSILFKRGSQWKEEFICYKGGASASSRLVFGAYGTGTAPIINGMEIVTGWTAETSGGSSGNGENFTDATGTRPVAWWAFSETTGTRASAGGGGNGLVPASSGAPTRGTGPHGQFSAEFSKAGTQQLELPESSMSTNFPGRSTLTNGNLTVGGWVRVDAETGGDAGIWGKDTNHSLVIEGNTVMFRIFNADNSVVAVSGEGTAYSQGTWRHYVCRYTQATGEMVLFVNGVKKTPATIATRNLWTGPFVIGSATFKGYFDGAVAEMFVSDAAMTDAQIASIHTNGLAGNRVTSGPTLYYKQLAQKPGAIFIDGTHLEWVRTKDDVTAGKEWWDAPNSRQYIRLVAEENPANHTVEVCTRVYPVRLQGSNYWTFEDIWVKGGLKANIFADTNNDGMVRRCTLTQATENGLHIYTHTGLSNTGFDASYNICYNNGACGITVAGQNAVSMAGIRIHHNETYGNCWQPWIKENGLFAYTGGIRPIGREINDIIVEDNYVHDEGNDGDYSHGCGIWFDTVGLNAIARRNRIERTTSWGIQIEDCNAVRLYSNLIVGTIYYPGIAIIRNCDNNLVYNNTLIDCNGGFNTSNGGGGSHFTGNQFYNNIVYGTSGWVVRADTGAVGINTSTFNKNIIGPNRTNMFNTDNTMYSTVAAWESNWGGTSNSISTNPTFVNLGSGDYHLAEGSVGRFAGTAIPAGTLDYSATAFTTSTPTIGAFEAVSANTITGTSAVRLPVLRGTGTGTRSSPSRTGVRAVFLKALTGTATGARSVSGITGTASVFLRPLTLSALGTIPQADPRMGTSTVFLKALRGTGSAARTIPSLSGTSPVTLRRLAIAALGTVGTTTARTGSGAVVLKVPTGTAGGARTIPARTGLAPLTLRPLALSALGTVGSSTTLTSVSFIRLPVPRTSTVGARTVPPRNAASAVRMLMPRHAGTIFKTNPGEIETVAHINAPAWRTADFGDGSSRVSWRSALDPGEKKAYTINCSTELSDQTNRIEIVKVTLSGLAILAGLRIRAMSYDRSNITLWLEIDQSDRFKSNWEGDGETHTLTCTIDVTDGQRFERDVSLQIKQLGQ